MFDERRAYQHVVNLAYLRISGSDGAIKAEGYIAETLKTAGVDAVSLRFSFSTLPDLLARLIPGACGTILWAMTIFLPPPSLTGAAVVAGLLFSATALFATGFPLRTLHLAKGSRFGINLLGEIPARSAARNRLYFVAHYDSKSQFLPIGVRAFCNCCLPVLAGIILLTNLLAFNGDPGPLRIIGQAAGAYRRRFFVYRCRRVCNGRRLPLY